MSRSRTTAFLSALALCALVAERGAAQSSEITAKDKAATDDALTYSDAVAFKAWSTGGEMVFEVEMKRPHVEGMFTCLHVFVDVDNKPKTGIDGAEVWLRAALGSRYHPNSFKPKKGQAALDIRRASFSKTTPVRGISGKTKSSRLNWLHTSTLAKPEVEEKKIRFRVPTNMLYGERTVTETIVGLYAEVETSSTDQPLMLRHLCNDAGVKIEIDGKNRDWSHPQIAKDPKGELHKVAQFLDIVSLRAEHDENRLYACVEFAEAGLSTDDLSRNDVSRFDGVTVYVEPVHPRYQDPYRVFLRYGKEYHPPNKALRPRFPNQTNRRGGWRGATTGKIAEVFVPRRSGQNGFRVWAWSDLRRIDRIPDEGWLKIDTEKKK